MVKSILFDFFADPDICMDYKALADPFETRIPIAITNTETYELWFIVELVSPPAGYTEYSKQLGSVGSGASVYKFFKFKRARPASKVTDDLTLRITAYTDAGYTTEYGYKDYAVKYYLFDRDDLTLVDADNFDDGTVQGWSGEVGTFP